MAPDRRREIKQNLKEPMKMRCLQEILPARHMADPLFCIVNDNRKVVGSPYILAREDDVAKGVEQDFQIKPMLSCMRSGRLPKPDFPNGVRSAEKGNGLADVQANCI